MQRVAWLWKAVAFAALSLLAAELFLQVGAWVVAASGREVPTGWLTGRTRVLAVGDSNTYGLYLDESEAYPAQLEAKWNARHPERPIEVLNVGFPGTSSFRVLDNFERLLDSLEPEIVLLMIGVNDRISPAEALSRDDETPPPSLLRWLREHSRLYRLIYIVRRSITPATVDLGERPSFGWIEDDLERFHAIYEWRQKRIGEAGARIEHGDEEFVMLRSGEASHSSEHLRENLASVAKIASDRGLRLYLLTYPWYEAPYLTPSNHSRQVAQELDVPLIDVAQQMERECASRGGCDEWFFRDRHPTAPGYAAVAAHLVEWLERDPVIGLEAK